MEMLVTNWLTRNCNCYWIIAKLTGEQCPKFRILGAAYPYLFINQGEFFACNTAPVVCCVKLHLDWCILSPLSGQKLQIWPDLENLRAPHHSLSPIRKKFCIGSVILCTKFHVDWYIVSLLRVQTPQFWPIWNIWALLPTLFTDHGNIWHVRVNL